MEGSITTHLSSATCTYSFAFHLPGRMYLAAFQPDRHTHLVLALLRFRLFRCCMQDFVSNQHNGMVVWYITSSLVTILWAFFPSWTVATLSCLGTKSYSAAVAGHFSTCYQRCGCRRWILQLCTYFLNTEHYMRHLRDVDMLWCGWTVIFYTALLLMGMFLIDQRW